GDIRETSGRHPGDIRETSGRHPGDIRETSGRHPEDIRKTSRDLTVTVMGVAPHQVPGIRNACPSVFRTVKFHTEIPGGS
ncbi:MAG: hypothetical protein LBT40_17350, partial [Deltaproteobacteria bacterium]|nr:hypothetical protein [Deltaproteobacteria bacterium]